MQLLRRGEVAANCRPLAPAAARPPLSPSTGLCPAGIKDVRLPFCFLMHGGNIQPSIRGIQIFPQHIGKLRRDFPLYAGYHPLIRLASSRLWYYPLAMSSTSLSLNASLYRTSFFSSCSSPYVTTLHQDATLSPLTSPAPRPASAPRLSFCQAMFPVLSLIRENFTP
jgi:hypothetical protein